MNISFKEKLIGGFLFYAGLAISLETLEVLATLSFVLFFLGIHILFHGLRSLRISYPTEIDKINE